MLNRKFQSCSSVRKHPMQSTKGRKNSIVVRKPPRKEDVPLIKETVRRRKNTGASNLRTITSMFKKKTATLVMNEKISKRDELPPYQAEMPTEKESLKKAKGKHIHHLNSILTNSTRKADLPIKII